MAVALLVAEVVIGALYVIASLFLTGEISLFLYGFGWGIFSASLAVLLTVKTFPEQ
jgi:Na+/pantothenate symporter